MTAPPRPRLIFLCGECHRPLVDVSDGHGGGGYECPEHGIPQRSMVSVALDRPIRQVEPRP